MPDICRPHGGMQGTEERLFDKEVPGAFQGEEILNQDLILWEIRISLQESGPGQGRPLTNPGLCEPLPVKPGGIMSKSGSRDEDTEVPAGQGSEILHQGWGRGSDIPGRVPGGIPFLPVSCIQFHDRRSGNQDMRNPFWQPKTTLNCRGRLVDLSTPAVMGILNVTPDSFVPQSRMDSPARAVDLAGQMLGEGATILDIGGHSSRPGATMISQAEESDRVMPTISALRKAFPEAILSVDTFRAELADLAIREGADMINDISGGEGDEGLWEVVAAARVPYILMHMRGNPQTMQGLTDYSDVGRDVLDWMIRKIGLLRQFRLHDILVDPGFGFSKTIGQNYRLLNDLHHFQILGLPILVGLSRKSMVWKPLGIDPSGALNGTTAVHMLALQQGARILRVHDVRPAVDVVRLWEMAGRPGPPELPSGQLQRGSDETGSGEAPFSGQ